MTNKYLVGAAGSSELTSMTATDLAQKIHARELSSEEVTQAHLDRIADIDGDIHAFLHVGADEALAAARQVDEQLDSGAKPASPLAGVPLALKDLFTTTDAPTTCGSKILEGYMSPYDATVTKRIREAGIPILGKTNTDEFAMGSSTENSAYGPTHNPWDLERTAGGSGGGSSAALASGEAPPGDRHRYRRVDPPAGGTHQHRGGQTHLRHSIPVWPGGVRILPGPGRSHRPHRARHRTIARGHRRPRPVRRHQRGPAGGPPSLWAAPRGLPRGGILTGGARRCGENSSTGTATRMGCWTNSTRRSTTSNPWVPPSWRWTARTSMMRWPPTT